MEDDDGRMTLSVSRSHAASSVRRALSPFLSVGTGTRAVPAAGLAQHKAEAASQGPGTRWQHWAAFGAGERRNQGWCELLGICLRSTYAVR